MKKKNEGIVTYLRRYNNQIECEILHWILGEETFKSEKTDKISEYISSTIPALIT